MAEERDIREAALRLLARREHSRFDLARKLASREFQRDAIDAELDELIAERLLSDERFAESYLWHRAQKGYGPLRIRAELQERGVDEEIIGVALAAAEIDWFELAIEQRRKRFGVGRAGDFKSLAKQKRFLSYRGFSGEQIRAATDDDKSW